MTSSAEAVAQIDHRRFLSDLPNEAREALTMRRDASVLLRLAVQWSGILMLCPRIANMFESTRTTHTNGIVRFIAWNIPYHTEHHVYPTVPFHRLLDLHYVMKGHLVNISIGYSTFNIEYIEELEARE